MSHRLVVVISNRCYVRSILLMAVKSRSKGILAPTASYGKSPCFSEAAFLQLFGPDYPLLILPCVDGQETLECAF